MSIRASFQKNLRTLRENAGYTTKEFAALIGAKYSTYAAYENQGREPRYDMLCKIVDTLGVTIDELIGHKISELTRCKYFVREAGLEINEVSHSGCITININLKELEKVSLISLLSVKEIYKAFPSGIVPTAIPNEQFIEIVSDAATNAEKAINPSRIAIMKQSLYLSFLTQIAIDIQNMKRQKQERSADNE